MTHITRRFLVASTALVLTGLAVWLFFPFQSVAERMVVSYFARYGVKVDHVTVESYTDSRLVVRELKIGDDLTLNNLILRYRLKELLEGRVQSVELDELKIALSQKDGKWRINALAPFFQSRQTSTIAVPLSDRLPSDLSIIKHVEIVLKQEIGAAQQFTADNFSFSPDNDAYLLRTAVISHNAQTAFFSPVSLEVKLTRTEAGIVVSGAITQKNDTIAAIEGNLSDSGIPERLSILPTLRFTASTKPSDIFPILQGKVPTLVGKLLGKITLIGKVKGEPAATIRVSELEVISDTAHAEGVDGTIILSSLTPPLTQGIASLKLRKLTTALPLEKGEVRFQLLPDDILRLLPTRWQWAGGTLTTAEQRFNLKKFTLDHVTFGAENIPLATLLSMVLKEGLAAEGTVSGTLPVQLKNGKFTVQNGMLKASQNGSVRYHPSKESPLQKGQNSQTDLLLQALENFHFTLMELTMNNETDSSMKLGLTIKGNNPDLYGGKPIDLNITLTGDLFGLVESGLKAYHLPETLEKQINEKRP